MWGMMRKSVVKGATDDLWRIKMRVGSKRAPPLPPSSLRPPFPLPPLYRPLPFILHPSCITERPRCDKALRAIGHGVRRGVEYAGAELESHPADSARAHRSGCGG